MDKVCAWPVLLLEYDRVNSPLEPDAHVSPLGALRQGAGGLRKALVADCAVPKGASLFSLCHQDLYCHLHGRRDCLCATEALQGSPGSCKNLAAGQTTCASGSAVSASRHLRSEGTPGSRGCTACRGRDRHTADNKLVAASQWWLTGSAYLQRRPHAAAKEAGVEDAALLRPLLRQVVGIAGSTGRKCKQLWALLGAPAHHCLAQARAVLLWHQASSSSTPPATDTLLCMSQLHTCRTALLDAGVRIMQAAGWSPHLARAARRMPAASLLSAAGVC